VLKPRQVTGAAKHSFVTITSCNAGPTKLSSSAAVKEHDGREEFCHNRNEIVIANYRQRIKDEKWLRGSTTETPKVAKSKIHTKAGKGLEKFGTKNGPARRGYAS